MVMPNLIVTIQRLLTYDVSITANYHFVNALIMIFIKNLHIPKLLNLEFNQND